MSNFLDPSTAFGSVILNILAGVGLVAVLAAIGWLAGPVRWLIAGRSLRQILLNGRSFIFVFNPTNGQAKILTFLPHGEIGEGKNSNEHSWRIHHGALEILAFDGLVYSRFVHDKKLGKLVHTNDPDTRSIHGQFIHPQFTPWSVASELISSSDNDSVAKRPPHE